VEVKKEENLSIDSNKFKIGSIKILPISKWHYIVSKAYNEYFLLLFIIKAGRGG
jgi:hypothetical protein